MVDLKAIEKMLGFVCFIKEKGQNMFLPKEDCDIVILVVEQDRGSLEEHADAECLNQKISNGNNAF